MTDTVETLAFPSGELPAVVDRLAREIVADMVANVQSVVTGDGELSYVASFDLTLQRAGFTLRCDLVLMRIENA